MLHHRSVQERIFDIFNPLLLLLFCVAVIFPILHIVAGALSSEQALGTGRVYFWPVEFTFSNLNHVLEHDMFWKSLRNSLFVVVVGTSVNLFFTFLTAYPLSKSYLPGKKYVILFIVFTMIFHAPLIPVFLVVKQLGLLNTLWAMILPAAISGFNMVLCMTFLRTIPEELYEAARIDGMREFSMLWKIALPLSKPILVTLLLFYAVGLWNNYFAPLLYINDRNMQPLQMYLYHLVAQADTSQFTNGGDDQAVKVNPQSVQMASILLATLPIVVLYPFLQKHFIKGAVLGSVKE
ncbi:MAG TPA: carbohydrate ABC transporter permease [Paenibacillus sp.]|nr:carbohydrate ABC transporter permease [Paenibacillus sp.]